jgi:transposase-like protein
MEKPKRQKLSLYELLEHFDTEEKAMKHIEAVRWEGSRCCPYCGSMETSEVSHKTMPYRCPSCRKYFSVRTGTLMEESRLPYRKWLTAIYLMGTSLKGVSSTKLANDIGITQKSAWFLAHRIRQAWDENARQFFGQVEIDETYLGGIEKNKHKSKKLKQGRGQVGKKPVIAMKERKSKKVKAMVVDSTDQATTARIIIENVARGTNIHTDEAGMYQIVKYLGYEHSTVNHKAGEYVRGEASTNSVESFWALLKRGYYGIYHRMSVKHLQKYIDEFANRANVRPLDTIDQINLTLKGLVGKRLTYQDLIR